VEGGTPRLTLYRAIPWPIAATTCGSSLAVDHAMALCGPIENRWEEFLL
jgi:hypothetical protein